MASGPACKQRFYPTRDQERFLLRARGANRWVWNWLLAGFKERLSLGLKEPTLETLAAEYAALKAVEGGDWLYEVSSVPVQQVLRQFNTARWDYLTGKKGMPKFKARKRRESGIKYTRSAFTYTYGEFSLGLIPGNLDIRWSYDKPSESPSSVTITQNAVGHWFISFVNPDATPELLHPAQNHALATDPGIALWASNSDGRTVENPLFAKREAQHIARIQKEIARRKKGSKNQQKSKDKLAAIHGRVANRRKDFTHKETTTMVRENQVIIGESLNVRGMMASAKGTIDDPGKNVKAKAGLSFAIADACFYERFRQLEYKCKWYNRIYIKVDQWFPSSKLCSNCGEKNLWLSLAHREWDCTLCGEHHHRDLNAALNLLAEGLRILAEMEDSERKRAEKALKKLIRQEALTPS